MSNNLAQPSDMLVRFDTRLVGDLVWDTNERASSEQLAQNAVVQEHLDQAAGNVYAALYVAYKYTAAELANITPTTASMLRGIVCDLAIVTLCQRRGRSYADKFPMVESSLFMLQALRNGERVLDLAAQEQAGLAAATVPSLCYTTRRMFVINNYHIFPLRGRSPY